MNSTTFRRHAVLLAFMLGEITVTWLALSISVLAVNHTPWNLKLAWQQTTARPLLNIVPMAAFHIVFLMRGLYASHRLENRTTEILNLLASVCIVAGIATVATVFLERGLATPMFVLCFVISLTTLVVIERSFLRSFLRRLHSHGRNIRSALIIGSGERAQRLAHEFHDRSNIGYRLVGCIDDVQSVAPIMQPCLGGLQDLSRILSETIIDEVFIALPMRSGYEQIQQAVLRCEEQGALITMPTDFFSARLARTRLGRIGKQPVLYLSAIPENDWRIAVKRGIDLIGSLALILLLSPVLAAVAIAVRCSSKGCIIFRQKRIGLNKRPFILYKFRTMVSDAETRQAELEEQNEVSGPVFKIRNDPRLTPIGRFLRRTSLDELPQLINVLKGEMSLVGPRPLPLRDVAGFREDWQRRRFSVLPGITCLWQLSGRSNISFEKWMELDLQYIDEWSLMLDLDILMRTASVVIKREGAY